MASLTVLVDDSGLIAVNKPAGIASTGRDLNDPECVQFRVQQQVGRRVWAVHQLDRDTSGVLLFVRRKSLVARWQDALGAGQKRYLALVRGVPDWPARRVREPLFYDRGVRRVRVGPGPGARRADTHLKLLERGEDLSWVLASPKTGRTHQIRAHLAHLGHPIDGDVRYGGPADSRFWLHCAAITLAERTLEAPLPKPMQRRAERAGLQAAPDL